MEPLEDRWKDVPKDLNLEHSYIKKIVLHGRPGHTILESLDEARALAEALVQCVEIECNETIYLIRPKGALW